MTPQEKAERQFKKKQQQQVEGAQAIAEYERRAREVRANMARLRELRLAREASGRATS
jgi:hypothetical protein